MAQDEGIRPSTTMEGLAKLKPAFKEGGCTTAGETGREVGRKGPGSGEEGAGKWGGRGRVRVGVL